VAGFTDKEDAIGHAMWDYYHTGSGQEIVENDFGNIGISAGPRAYFTEYKDWASHQKKAIRFARGRILEIGCGAGRFLLYLKRKGHKVAGIDISPLAVRVCRKRGLRTVHVRSITQIGKDMGIFDTIIMFGNNFGLFASRKRARWLLRRMYHMTSAAARIIVESLDTYDTANPEDLAYHAYNRRRGRLAGQLRLRVRYKIYKTPWFDYLIVSPDEMRDIVAGTGWTVARIIESSTPRYCAVIEKKSEV
jgi:SAM-dependent methyltransferase